ncbi:MAG: hypothetical protein CM15mP84_06580 [Cellvibrionales bacterium]|nr:MAG: hypothetical protein CM15mP84_06580 [Cellvibrionales bacterium]
MEQDWAILKAMQPIAGRYWIPISQKPLEAGAKISAVGFAPVLTDPVNVANRDPTANCWLTSHAGSLTPALLRAPLPVWPDRAASGGAILSRTASGGVRVAGIISAGDGHSISLFYPTWFLLQRIRALR